jgi:hypothetical protein
METPCRDDDMLPNTPLNDNVTKCNMKLGGRESEERAQVMASGNC